MVIITGLGRCGTSILTKYLNEVGFSIGKNVNWHNEARAGLELSPMYTLVDDLYNRYIKLNKEINLEDEPLGDYWKGFTYREAFNKIDKDERQGTVDLVKDPRITWHPDIIKAIWKVRPDLKLIICHRKVENIYKSRKALPIQYDDPKPRKTLDEYKIDFSDFFTKVLELDIQYKLLFFPDFLKYFNMTYEKLNEWLPHDYDKGKEVWNEIIDNELLK